MNTKRIAALLAAIMICTTAGCGKKSSDTSSETDGSSSVEFASDESRADHGSSDDPSSESETEEATETTSKSEDNTSPKTDGDTTSTNASTQPATEYNAQPITTGKAASVDVQVEFSGEIKPASEEDNIEATPNMDIIPFQTFEGETPDDIYEPVTEPETDASGGEDDVKPPVDNSDIKSVYTLWLDVREGIDYYFNDEFVKVTFKVKDTASGDYEIRLKPDLSNVMGVSQNKKMVVRPGIIRVGKDAKQQDVSDVTQILIYGDNVSCQPGDTVDYYIRMKNNPGLAAIMMWISYDANGLEILSCTPAGEFAEIAAKSSMATGQAGR